MGKGYNNYMTKKFFHPGSKENIKRVWMAQQKTEYEKKKQEDLSNQYQKEQEMYAHRALLGDEKAKLGLSFMYDAPPGANKNREKEDDEPEYKFEWQGKYKAPREEYIKNDEGINDQPFGIEVRNVRCIKCRKWGHMNTDIICPLFKEALTAEPPQPKDNEMDLIRDLQEDGLKLKQVVMGRKVNPYDRNQQMLDSDEEDDPEAQFLNTLSAKQRKKLLKKIEKLGKKGGKKKKRSKSASESEEEQPKSKHSKYDDHSSQKSHSSHIPTKSHRKEESSDRYGHYRKQRSPSPDCSTSTRHKSSTNKPSHSHRQRSPAPEEASHQSCSSTHIKRHRSPSLEKSNQRRHRSPSADKNSHKRNENSHHDESRHRESADRNSRKRYENSHHDESRHREQERLSPEHSKHRKNRNSSPEKLNHSRSWRNQSPNVSHYRQERNASPDQSRHRRRRHSSSSD